MGRSTGSTRKKIPSKSLTLLRLKSILYDYSEAHVIDEGTMRTTRARTSVAVRRSVERNKQLLFEYDAPFTDYISKINNM